MNDQAELSARWQALARRTARKVNLGWWLEFTAPALILTGLLAFPAILWLRSQGWILDLQKTWPWAAGILAVLMIVSAVLARRRFLSASQALVRLESQLHLHNALSVAASGRAPWPQIPATVQDGWTWRWSTLARPWLIGIASLLLAFWIPLSPEASVPLVTQEPQAWQQMEQWLKNLEEEKIITPEEKEEQTRKIADLREQPQDKWFSHDSLHASDTLKDQLQRDMARIAQNMKTAERSLNALQNYADKLSPAGKDQLLQDLDEAMKALENSELALDPDLLKELAQIDPKNLPSMSQQQLNELREALKNNAGALDGMNKNPGFLGDGEGSDDELAEMLGRSGQGQGRGQGNEDGEGSGQGGIDRGPGTAPLTLADNEDNFGTDKREGLSNADLSRAQLGTMLGLKNGEHEVDKTYQGPTAAGTATHQGQGGEQVWRETLTPEEKAVLKRVFR